jgi:hypothetical protein
MEGLNTGWLGDMARASRRKFENVDKQAFVRITGVIGQHPLVNVLLGAFTLITGSEKSASWIWSQTGLKAGRLGVIVSVVDNDSPIPIDVTSTLGHSIEDLWRTQVPIGTDPMGGVIRTEALGGSGVILVIKGLLLELVHVLNQVIGRLVGYIGEFLVKQVVLRDGMFDFIFGVVGVV